jgi:putative glycosyltransferase
MKVLITDVALTPYTHAQFERISSKGCEILVLLPRVRSSVGKNVKECKPRSHTYKLCYSRVKKKWYGKHALIDLKDILIKEKPDVLVLVWPYLLHLFFDRTILYIMNRDNIRLVIREIPFQTPPFGKLDYFAHHPAYDEDLNLLSTGFLFKVRAWSTMYIRRFIYQRAHAYIAYYSQAKNIVLSYGLSSTAFFYGNTNDTDSLLSIRQEILDMPPLLEKRRRILHIGRLVKWKKVDLLISAFSLIAKNYQDCELVIVGDGPEKGFLVRKSVDLSLDDKILFAGAVYDPIKLAQYMKESSVYVLAGMGGLSINDAMCFSLPIICSTCDGTEKDLVTEGVNGFFFEKDNANDLAEKLDLILSNLSRAIQMGERSLQIIKERANLDVFANMYRDALIYAINI